MRRLVGGIAVAAMIAVGGWSQACAQAAMSAEPIEFNIPAQPLARALVAFSAVTGLEIFYNAALADHQNSRAVMGLLPPATALQMLLRDTGYTAKSTAVGALTIAPAPPETAAAAAEDRRRLQSYFASIQHPLGDILCRNAPAVTSRELLLRFWLLPTGVVDRAEVIDDEGRATPDQSYAALIRGLTLAAPPAGMAQPVNMVLFPPSRTSRACGPADVKRGAG